MDTREENRKKMFTELYDTHADAIFRFCFFKTGDREIAKDLTQDVFMKVLNYLVEKDIQNPKSFIYTIARNAVIDFWRKSKSVPESHLPEGFFESIAENDSTQTTDDHSTFLSLLDKLSEFDREVIILRYVDEMSSKDIAEMLGERQNTVLVRISRAKEKLRILLRKTKKNEKGI